MGVLQHAAWGGRALTGDGTAFPLLSGKAVSLSWVRARTPACSLFTLIKGTGTELAFPHWDVKSRKIPVLVTQGTPTEQDKKCQFSQMPTCCASAAAPLRLPAGGPSWSLSWGRASECSVSALFCTGPGVLIACTLLLDNHCPFSGLGYSGRTQSSWYLAAMAWPKAPLWQRPLLSKGLYLKL